MSGTPHAGDPVPDRAGVGQPTAVDPCDEGFDTLADTVPIAVIAFDFDPLVRLAETLVVRWQTIALAIVIAAALIVAGVIARRASLRPDDLLFITVGIVPGAVIGGRLGYVLLHLDYYAANPGAILDPASGGLELGLAVVGWPADGQLRGPPPRCPDRALVAGRRHAAPVRARRGQADHGPRRCRSGPAQQPRLGDGLPRSRPVELAGAGPAVAPVTGVRGLRHARGPAGARPRARGGRSRVTPRRRAAVSRSVLAAWALVRVLASLTWRDPAVLGPLNAGSVIALALIVGCVAAALIITARPRDKDTEQSDTGHEDARDHETRTCPRRPGR